MLDRATYKKIKAMSREEMQNFLTNYYHNVIEDVATIDLDQLRKTSYKKSSPKIIKKISEDFQEGQADKVCSL